MLYSTNESTMEVTDSDAIMVTATSDTEMDSSIDCLNIARLMLL